MGIFRDKADPKGRTSMTKVAAAAQGGTVLVALGLGLLNRRFGWGIPEKDLAAVAAFLVAALQAAANAYQRRATEKVESVIRQRSIR
jgi:hypothetical protein